MEDTSDLVTYFNNQKYLGASYKSGPLMETRYRQSDGPFPSKFCNITSVGDFVMKVIIPEALDTASHFTYSILTNGTNISFQYPFTNYSTGVNKLGTDLVLWYSFIFPAYSVKIWLNKFFISWISNFLQRIAAATYSNSCDYFRLHRNRFKNWFHWQTNYHI